MFLGFKGKKFRNNSNILGPHKCVTNGVSERGKTGEESEYKDLSSTLDMLILRSLFNLLFFITTVTYFHKQHLNTNALYHNFMSQ